ncbi:hypothetical protein B0J18DRAFT_11395 [Chaetomium sp. MPI-SDFR-AT-0129]|nr:hypothetical protein B0J18DRAFT_11395 [Chaetomium sp. MPI-SDFR-AT-0129]
MGSSGSKTAQNAIRKFPVRAPGSSPAAVRAPSGAATSNPQPVATPATESKPRARPQASYTKDDAILADSIDPNRPEFSADFANRLQQMGIVQPNPTYSPSSIASPFPAAFTRRQNQAQQTSPQTPQFPSPSSNTTLGALEVRRALEARAKQELERMGKPGDEGREFLDIGTVEQVILLRQNGTPAKDIEARLRLKPGLVARLGVQGVVTPAT